MSVGREAALAVIEPGPDVWLRLRVAFERQKPQIRVVPSAVRIKQELPVGGPVLGKLCFVRLEQRLFILPLLRTSGTMGLFDITP